MTLFQIKNNLIRYFTMSQDFYNVTIYFMMSQDKTPSPISETKTLRGLMKALRLLHQTQLSLTLSVTVYLTLSLYNKQSDRIRHFSF